MPLDFIGRAILGGVGIALIAGPMGSIMVWRRLANFGDTLAHSTLLGICFALFFNIDLYFGLISVSVIIAGILALLSQQKWVAMDALLVMLSHTTLAIGLILATVLPGIRVDLLGFLYGDILAIDNTDLIWIYSASILGLLALTQIWRPLLSLTIDEDLAKVEGVPVKRVKGVLMLIMAIIFAIAMKLIGVLLITALLVIPASTARQFSKTPEQMAVLASILGIISVSLGIFASQQWDWPAGPAIVVSAAALFVVSLFSRALFQKAA